MGIPRRQYFLPPVPDRLFVRLGLKTKLQKGYATEQAESFVDALKRMSTTEKQLVAYVFLHGCPTDLPSNIHINIDLLRRISGLPVSKCIRELKQLGSLGFRTRLSRHKNPHGDLIIELTFDVRRIAYSGPDDATGTVNEMLECLTDEYCQDCALRAILDGDFSVLATATKRPEKHASRKKAERRRPSASGTAQ